MGATKRGNKWWVDFMFGGQRYRKASPDNSMAGAKTYEALLRQKLARGEPLKQAKHEDRKILFKDFAHEWFQVYVKNNNKHSEILAKESVLRVHLIPHFGNMELNEIGNFDVEKFKAKKIQENLSAKTINNHLTVLHKSLRCALEWGSLKNFPIIKKLKMLPVKFDYLNDDECQKLIGAAYGTWPQMIKVALGTGLRFGELIALTWDDIDLEKGELTVRQAFAKGVLGSPKSNKIRRIPMTTAVYETLYGMKMKKGYIFPQANGKPLSHGSCDHHIHRICRMAGLRKIGWHCLRHTFASQLAQRGANLVAIQGLLGHSEIRTTMRYAHINDKVFRDAIGVLDDNREKPNNLCHNIVTAPISNSATSETVRREKSDLFANIKQKRAEALF
jgi:integrase